MSTLPVRSARSTGHVVPIQPPTLVMRVEKPIYLAWLGAHVTAFILALPLYLLVQTLLRQRQETAATTVSLTITLIVCSLVIGVLQGLIIHKQFDRVSWRVWAVVTALTLLLASGLSSWLANGLTQQGYRTVMDYYTYVPLGGAFIGVLLGLTQLIVLKNWVAEPQSWIWVPTLAFVGALVSTLLFWPILDNILHIFGREGWLVKLFISSICAGLVSGIPLQFLIRRSTQHFSDLK